MNISQYLNNYILYRDVCDVNDFTSCCIAWLQTRNSHVQWSIRKLQCNTIKYNEGDGMYKMCQQKHQWLFCVSTAGGTGMSTKVINSAWQYVSLLLDLRLSAMLYFVKSRRRDWYVTRPIWFRSFHWPDEVRFQISNSNSFNTYIQTEKLVAAIHMFAIQRRQTTNERYQPSCSWDITIKQTG